MNDRKGRPRRGGGRPRRGAPKSKATDRKQSDRLETQRAEEMLDRMTQTVGGFASRIGLQILKGAALAREEAEDIWAEAQSRRRSREP